MPMALSLIHGEVVPKMVHRLCAAPDATFDRRDDRRFETSIPSGWSEHDAVTVVPPRAPVVEKWREEQDFTVEVIDMTPNGQPSRVRSSVQLIAIFPGRQGFRHLYSACDDALRQHIHRCVLGHRPHHFGAPSC